MLEQIGAGRHRRPACRLLSVALWAVAATWGIVPAAGAAQQSHTVSIEGMRFVPDGLTVSSGDRITWINKDLVPHTVTNKTFASQVVAPNASWSYTAVKPGQYPYGCTLHPTMKATLSVR